MTGHGLTNIKYWLVLALLFSLINRHGETIRSPLWFLEFVLFGLMTIGILWRERLKTGLPLRLAGWSAALAYLGLFWLFGMTYELTLTVTGEGIGGMHSQTYPSFVLAQGDYLPMALLSLATIRWCRLTFHQAWFLAVGIALTEGLIFNRVLLATLLSPHLVIAPLVLAYYSFAYGCFVAMPLLILDEQGIWRAGSRREWWSVTMVAIGFVEGIAIRLVWGLIYGPLVQSWLHLPPDPA